MTSAAAQLAFGVEFATFLVAVAGASLVLLRPNVLEVESRPRTLLAAGFFALAAAAFLHGSSLLARDHAVVLALRAVAIVLLLLGSLGWRNEPALRPWLWGALTLVLASTISAGIGAGRLADWFLAGGALGLGAVLFVSSRRSIPARVATSAATTLLLVVLALSIALSAVITRTVQNEAVNRVDARAGSEAEEVTNPSGQVGNAIKAATLIGASLKGARGDLLRQLSDHPVHDATIEADLANLGPVLPAVGPRLYVTDKGTVVAGLQTDPAAATLLAGSQAVGQAMAKHTTIGSLQLVGKLGALDVGAEPVTVVERDGSQRLVGVAVATVAIDDSYLRTRSLNEPSVTLAVVSRDGVVAVAGPSVPTSLLTRLGRSALGEAGVGKAATKTSFLAARPMNAADGTPVAALVASTPTTLVAKTRQSLFRTLFVVALGTSLLALIGALVVGEHIGAGLRRLTDAAEGIRRGDLGVRASVRTVDEVGVLSDAFDSMATSIETMAGELRQAAEDEAQLRNRLEAVVGGMGEALLAVDTDGFLTTFNPAAESLFAVNGDDAMGRSAADVARLVGPDGDDLAARLFRPRAGTWSGAATVVRGDGEEVPVAVSVGGLQGPAGDLTGAVLVLRDMRREREVERMKTEFLSNISHELRTPLTPIKGYAEMLRSRDVPKPRAKEFVSGILTSADRLERVVDLLVSFAAFEAGKLPLRTEPVKPKDLIDTVVSRWRTRTDELHPIERRVARNIPEVVGDRRLLERSLDELLDNAIKFSPRGGKVSVAACMSDNGHGPELEIAVTDRGVGIPDDRLATVFGDFAQADGGATRQFGGMGLGLAFVRRIVRAHDGDITCESTPGKGSTFSILLPIVPKQGKTATDGARKKAGSRGRTRKKAVR